MKTLPAAVLFCMLAMASPAFAGTSHEVTLPGSISTVSATSITILVSNQIPKVLKISKHTKITLDGAPSTADKLAAGMTATVVTSNERSKDAKDINATSAKTAPAASGTTAAPPAKS